MELLRRRIHCPKRVGLSSEAKFEVFDFYAREEGTTSGQKMATVSEFLRDQANKYPDAPIIGYPNEQLEYTVYTLREVDTYADNLASRYGAQLGAASEKPKVVGLLGESTFEYLLTANALARLGYTTLFLSTRLSAEVVAYLLNKVGSEMVIVSKTFEKTIAETKAEFMKDLMVVPMIGDYKTGTGAQVTFVNDPERPVWIIHSSGSTGYPKPVLIKNKSALANYTTHPAEFSFCTMPLYHAQGLSNFFRAVNAVKPMYLWSASRPPYWIGFAQCAQALRFSYHLCRAVCT